MGNTSSKFAVHKSKHSGAMDQTGWTDRQTDSTIL